MRIVYGLSAVLWVLYLVLAATWQSGWMPDISLMRRITTFECPFNGLTRSFFAVAHGEIIAAFRLNPMFPVYVAILGYLIVTTTRLSFGFIDSVNAKPILAVTAATMGLTIIVKLIDGTFGTNAFNLAISFNGRGRGTEHRQFHRSKVLFDKVPFGRARFLIDTPRQADYNPAETCPYTDGKSRCADSRWIYLKFLWLVSTLT